METLGTPEILAAIASGLGDWRKLAQPLATRYRSAGDGGGAAGARNERHVGAAGAVGLAAGAAFVAAVAEAAVAADRDPEIRLARGYVDVALFTVDPDTGGRWVTAQDLELARTISALARRHGLTAVPGEVAQLELGLDTADRAAVSPFWSALLTGAPGRTVEEVLDPTNRVPNIWHQGTEAHETPRQRWHLDLWLAPEVVDERIAAAVAAGGTVVDDTGAPVFTVLADPEGNKACICTALGRD